MKIVLVSLVGLAGSAAAFVPVKPLSLAVRSATTTGTGTSTGTQLRAVEIEPPSVQSKSKYKPLVYEITHLNPDVSISESQLESLIAKASWEVAPTLTSPGRCVWEVLDEPATCSHFPGLDLVSAKMKGIGFYNPKSTEKVHGGVLANDHAENTVPPSTEVLEGMLTFPHFGVDKDRNYAIKFSARTPLGGILHSRAMCEYESAKTLSESSIPTIVPLAVLKYPELTFEGQPMGAAICLQPEKESIRLSGIQYGDTHYGVSDEIDSFYDKIRDELNIEGNPTQEETRLATINVLSLQIGQRLRQLSLSGLFRHSSEWSNFEYSFDEKSIFFTDLDSTLNLNTIAEPKDKILHVMRDLGTAAYRLVAKFGYPKSLGYYTLGNLLAYDPLCELLVGYFPEADRQELRKASQRLWRAFIPHFELLKRHKEEINGDWTRSHRQTYKMDNELFYVLTMQSTWQFYEKSELMKAYPTDVTYDTLDNMAKEFLKERYDLLDYYLSDGFVDPSLSYLKKKYFEGRGWGVVTTKAIQPGETIFEGQLGQLFTEANSHNSQLSEHVWMLHGGLSQFMNHCCDPNSGFRVNKLGSHDAIARKALKPGDEITVDYAMRNYVIKYMPECQCGSPICRKQITGWRDLPEDRRQAYKDFSVPYVWNLADQDQIRANLAAERAKISRACKELNRAEPTLVAVSKTMPKHILKSAYERGQLHFGENFLDELVQKSSELPQDILWHFLGALPLSLDKAKSLVSIPNLDLVESANSMEMVDLLQEACSAVDRKEPVKILIQVNTSGDDTRAGVSAGESTLELIKHVMENCPQLQFAGLMTIGALGVKTDSPPTSEECFDVMTQCKADVMKSGIAGMPEEIDFVMSMGMSGDWRDAVSAGASNIRLGSTIFGAQRKPASN